MSVQTSASLRQVKARKPITIQGIWRQLTEPAEEVKRAELRRQMRFLLSLLVVVIPLGLVGVVVSTLANPSLLLSPGIWQNPIFLVLIGADLLLIVAYLLARSVKHYNIGAAIAVAAVAVVPTITAIQDPATATDMLGYLALDVLLASLLLPLMWTVILAVVDSLIVLLIPPLLSPEITIAAVTNTFIFVVIMSILIIVSASIRQQNIQQIERQSRELEQAVKQAVEANRLKSEFLATMSHELRTPLNAIIGFAEVMLMGLAGSMDEKVRHTTKRIHFNSERLLSLIDDLLDISRIEANRVDLIVAEFKPEDLLDNVRRVIEPQAAEKDVAYITEADPALPPKMYGDIQRLERIMINLAGNAVKFTDEGHIKVSLERVDEDQWCIKVADTGIGIARHAQEFIFDKFRQVDGTSRRAYMGAGLGLAIVKELTLLMKGNVRVDSAPGEGSTFTVTLPFVEPEG
ncbi:MAG: hypothetical protein JXJ17_01170 [Anaerolineae bacterium]|nr:hypothetical protein [Anaerolineae bacterium]